MSHRSPDSTGKICRLTAASTVSRTCTRTVLAILLGIGVATAGCAASSDSFTAAATPAPSCSKALQAGNSYTDPTSKITYKIYTQQLEWTAAATLCAKDFGGISVYQGQDLPDTLAGCANIPSLSFWIPTSLAYAVEAAHQALSLYTIGEGVDTGGTAGIICWRPAKQQS